MVKSVRDSGANLAENARDAMAHRGAVNVRSRRNGGTTVDIRLPLVGVDGQKRPLPSSPENVLQHARIIVASRNELTISQVRSALAGIACNVVGAGSFRSSIS